MKDRKTSDAKSSSPASVPQAAPDEQLWDVKKAAHYLNITEEKARRLAKTGELVAFKVGVEWRFMKSLIDEYLFSQITRKKPG